MTFDPTAWPSWTRFDEHPIFGPEKSNIASWSHDPTQYGNLSNYAEYLPEYYVHVDPPPPVDWQREIATRDIANLAASCQKIIEQFGDSRHEIVILDDFTVFVWLKNEQFTVAIYPLQLDEENLLMLFAEPPLDIEELRFPSVDELVKSISERINGRTSDRSNKRPRN